MTARDVIPPPPGIYVPVPTFFKPPPSKDGDKKHDPVDKTYASAVTPPPDLKTQVAHSVYLAQRGIRGLTLLGSTGEAVHLTNGERGSILKAVREGLTEAGFPDYPIIAGTASNSVDEVVGQLENAKECGAQWGLVLAPGYFAGAARPDGVIAWFTAVADRSPLPILIYHYPAVSNSVKVPPSVYHALAPHPNVVGCKLSHGDASVHAQIALHPFVQENPLSFSAFTGLGQHLLPVMAVGCVGAIDGSAGFFPRTLVRLWSLAAKAEGLPSCFKTHEAVRRGSIGLWERGSTGLSKEERKELRVLQYRVSAMEELVVAHGTVGIKEAIARLRQFGDIDGTRLPLMGGLPGGDAEWARWGEVIGAVEEIEMKLEKDAGEKTKPAASASAQGSKAGSEKGKDECAVEDAPEAPPLGTEATAAANNAPNQDQGAEVESPKEYGEPVRVLAEAQRVSIVNEAPKGDGPDTVSEGAPGPAVDGTPKESTPMAAPTQEHAPTELEDKKPRTGEKPNADDTTNTLPNDAVVPGGTPDGPSEAKTPVVETVNAPPVSEPAPPAAAEPAPATDVPELEKDAIELDSAPKVAPGEVPLQTA